MEPLMIALGLSITPPDFSAASDTHVGTQWKILYKGVEVYDSGELDTELLSHTAEIPSQVKGMTIGTGNQTFYIKFRVKGSVSGWSSWSGLNECNVSLGFKPPTAYEIGPIERNETVKGLRSRLWKVELRDAVYIARQNEPPASGWRQAELLFEPSDAVENMSDISFTFDQLGRPVVFYEVSGNIRGYYYDGIAGTFDVWEIGSGRTPRGKLEFRDEDYLSESDIILFYIRSDGALCYRLQSDRYDTEYETGLTGYENSYLKQLDNTEDNRLCLTYITEGAGYGNAGVSGDCFTFNFAVSDQYKVPLQEGNYPVSMSVSFDFYHGSRRVAVHTYEINEKLFLEAELTHGSRKSSIYFYYPIESLQVSGSVQAGSRYQAINIFPFESEKDIYIPPEDQGDPETLSQTDKQGLELLVVSGSVSAGTRRVGIIEIYSYNPVCEKLEVSGQLTGGSRNVPS
jgi:hypothetical protein